MVSLFEMPEFYQRYEREHDRTILMIPVGTVGLHYHSGVAFIAIDNAQIPSVLRQLKDHGHETPTPRIFPRGFAGRDVSDVDVSGDSL